MSKKDAKIKKIEDKIPDITNLATDTTLNAKMNEVKGEITSITNLATTAALTAVENKIPNVSNLVRKTGYNIKSNAIKKKITDHDHSYEYITTPEFNKLTVENFAARLKQANLTSKSDIGNLVDKTNFDNKLLSFNKRINTNKTKYGLVEFESNEQLKKVQPISTKGLTKVLINGYKVLNGAIYFSLETLQNNLIHFSYKKCFRFFTNTSKVCHGDRTFRIKY